VLVKLHSQSWRRRLRLRIEVDVRAIMKAAIMAVNNLHIPDELLDQAQRVAERQGRTAEDLASDALKQYLAHEQLNELSRYGQERAQNLGLEKLSEEEREAYVDRAIRETRKERQQ
jgi:predicted transcriptional regulator